MVEKIKQKHALRHLTLKMTLAQDVKQERLESDEFGRHMEPAVTFVLLDFLSFCRKFNSGMKILTSGCHTSYKELPFCLIFFFYYTLNLHLREILIFGAARVSCVLRVSRNVRLSFAVLFFAEIRDHYSQSSNRTHPMLAPYRSVPPQA